jgi:glucokinase
MSILCGDIGGTKTRLALLRRGPSGWEILREQTYASGDYHNLTDIGRAFLDKIDHTPGAAGFGLAGPVRGRQCRITNLPWLIDADALEKELDIPTVILLNDLEAVAWGIDALGNGDCVTLQPGLDPASGNRCVIAPGTGLGEAGLYWDGETYHPFATEGGHCDFAPTTPQQLAFHRYLQNAHPQPAWENVLSGAGLVSIYSFLLAQAGAQPPEWFLSAQKEGDGAAGISQAADTGSDSTAAAAMEEFARLLGSEAGNLALKHMATGGLYIGGGIAPKILQWLQRPLFLEAFHNKGKMRALMQTIPIHLIRNERVALFGPALFLDKHD